MKSSSGYLRQSVPDGTRSVTVYCPTVYDAGKRAQLCPVCNGAGTLPSRPDASSTAANLSRTCHGCGGKGWVTT